MEVPAKEELLAWSSQSNIRKSQNWIGAEPPYKSYKDSPFPPRQDENCGPETAGLVPATADQEVLGSLERPQGSPLGERRGFLL